MKTAILILQGLMMTAVVVTACLGGRFDFGDSIAFLIGGVILEVIGLGIAFTAVRTLKSNLTVRIDPRSQLITHGIYNLSRNPIYLGALIMCCGWALLFHSALCAFATIGLAVVLNIKIRMEEHALQEKFGGEFSQYRQKTARWCQLPFL